MRVVKHWNDLPREVTGNIQGQVGLDSEQRAQVGDTPAHGGEVGLGELEVIFKPLYDSIIPNSTQCVCQGFKNLVVRLLMGLS